MRTKRQLAWGAALWTGLALAAGPPSPPERPRFQYLGVADGLPASAVTAIAQDRAGYLWLASNDGLARFDGREYRYYRHEPEHPGSLPGNALQALHIDALDRIWVAVESQGVCRLDADRGSFVCLDGRSRPRLGSDEIWSIASTADGAQWFGSFGGGLFRLDPRGQVSAYVHRDGDPRSLPSDNVLALAVDRAGVLWVGTTAGVAAWDGRSFAALPTSALSHPVVFSLSADPDGSLWIGTQGGLDRRLPGGRIEHPPWREALSEPGVTAVLRDRQGGRWIATRHGLNRERNGQVERFENERAGRLALLAAFEDRDGGLWFGSADSGIARLPPDWRRFSALAYREGDPEGLVNARTLGLADAGQGKVWLVGGNQALDRLDLASGQVEHLAQGPRAFPDRRLYAVLQRSDGSVWVGHQLGLSRIDPRDGRRRDWLADSVADAALQGPVRLLAEDADGLLWSASLGYGMQARDRDGRVVHSLPALADLAHLGDPEQLLRGPDGALWVADGEGLHRWDKANHRLRTVPGSPRERVFAVAFRTPEWIWLHRLGALEAWRWDGQGLARRLRVDAAAGLPAFEGSGLLIDARGRAWLTSARGLWCYDPQQASLRRFTERDGLPSQEFPRRLPVLSDRGLAVATIGEGLLVFAPETIAPSPLAPPLVIQGLAVRRGNAVQALGLPVNAALKLQPEDRDLRVTARLLAFADPAAHRFRFRLHGYDSSWVEVGAEGERVFPALEPGHYRLDVQGAAADGPWSPPRGFELDALPPWWLNPWAFAAYAGAALLALVAAARLYRWRLKRRHARQLARERRELIEQASQAKTRFLATLGHEIRTPLTGVLGMAELMLGGELAEPQRTRAEALQRAGQHLLRLLNDALDLARIEAGRLPFDIAPFEVAELLREAEALLRPLAAAKGLQFSIDDARAPPWVNGDGARVRQILFNLGSNAIKFTERGDVVVQVSRVDGGGLRIEVRDTGPGMDAEQQARLFQRFEQAEGGRTATRFGGSGLGLAICRELCLAMGGRIDLQSAPGQGSRFRVELPLPEVEAPSAALPESQAEGHGRGLAILLVEDEPLVAEVVSGLLANLGHTVMHAPQALAALSLLGLQHVDLLVLDLDLPGMDGLQLARLLRAQGLRLPLLALTARADGEAEAQARASGMDGFLRKPVTAALLHAAIEACLAQSSSGSTSQSTR